MKHGASAAGFPSRNPAALALIFFVHLAALFLWMRQRPERLPDVPVPQVLGFFLRPAPPKPVFEAERRQPPAPARSAAGPRRPLPLPAVPLDEVQPAPAPAAAVPSPLDSAKPAPRLEDLRAPMSVQDAIREQQAADGGFAASLARRQASRIDRALRNGKPGVPDEPDTPIGRLRRGLEAAHVDRSKAVYEDSYTSPDGTVIHRKRIGKGMICRRGGNVSPLGMRRMSMAGEAADEVPCPRGVDWKAE